MEKHYIIFHTGLGCLAFLVLAAGAAFVAWSVQLVLLSVVGLSDSVSMLVSYLLLAVGLILVAVVSVRVDRRAAEEREEDDRENPDRPD